MTKEVQELIDAATALDGGESPAALVRWRQAVAQARMAHSIGISHWPAQLATDRLRGISPYGPLKYVRSWKQLAEGWLGQGGDSGHTV